MKIISVFIQIIQMLATKQQFRFQIITDHRSVIWCGSAPQQSFYRNDSSCIQTLRWSVRSCTCEHTHTQSDTFTCVCVDVSADESLTTATAVKHCQCSETQERPETPPPEITAPPYSSEQTHNNSFSPTNKPSHATTALLNDTTFNNIML